MNKKGNPNIVKLGEKTRFRHGSSTAIESAKKSNKKQKLMKELSKNINKDVFETLCSIHCTEKEILAKMKVDRGTLDFWCKQEYETTLTNTIESLRSNGNIALRKNQFELSKKNPGMAVFLGKQWLGQKDEPSEQDTSDEITKVLLVRKNV